jgi:hypothetical protein
MVAVPAPGRRSTARHRELGVLQPRGRSGQCPGVPRGAAAPGSPPPPPDPGAGPRGNPPCGGRIQLRHPRAAGGRAAAPLVCRVEGALQHLPGVGRSAARARPRLGEARCQEGHHPISLGHTAPRDADPAAGQGAAVGAGRRAQPVTDFAIAVEISAPPDRVWAVMSDVAHWPDWTPTVTRVEPLEPGPLAVGQRARIRQPRLPIAVWRVAALEPGRSFTWMTRSPGVEVTARHSVVPTDAGSRAHLALHFGGILGPLVARITRGLNIRYLGLEAAGLRQRCEASRGRG